jgi:hypothetical protein
LRAGRSSLAIVSTPAERGKYELTPDEADRIEQTLRHEAARMRILSKKLKAGEELHA